jgi:protein involved in ribonucleotide reduction
MSLTGNVKSFVERVGMDSFELNPANPYKEVNEDYIVVVPSYVGYITDDVMDFIDYKDNLKHLVGFVGSGNLNFNDLFLVNAKELSTHYNKPILFAFEYQGTEKDVEDFKKEVYDIEITRTKQEK